MRLGLIARADNTGLGMQTWEFYKHMRPDKTMVVDISKWNTNKQYPERYHSDTELNDQGWRQQVNFISGFPTDQDVREFLTDLDVVFIAESSYNPKLYIMAREMGVKIAVQYNYEFFDWFNAPHEHLPHMFIAPSLWHFNKVNKFCQEKGLEHVYLHCPVNRDELPFRTIRSFQTFLHIAGKPASHDRNGTETVIKAAKFLKTPAKIKIHFQGEQGLGHQTTYTVDDYRAMVAAENYRNNIEVEQKEYDNYADAYKEGDVMLLPRRYGGNCLPVNEALSVGMPVIMTDISPNNHFLPHEWLVPAIKVDEFAPRFPIDIFNSAPQDLAAKIDEFYNMPQLEIRSNNSLAGLKAMNISWEQMAPRYRAALERLCNQ